MNGLTTASTRAIDIGLAKAPRGVGDSFSSVQWELAHRLRSKAGSWEHELWCWDAVAR